MSENTEKIVQQGQHLLADMFGVEDARLSDPAFFAELLKELATSAQLTPLGEAQVCHNGQGGCNGFLLLKDAHISLHTFPKAHYLALDIFVSGENDPEDIFNHFAEKFTSQMVRKTTITRGLQG